MKMLLFLTHTHTHPFPAIMHSFLVITIIRIMTMPWIPKWKMLFTIRTIPIPLLRNATSCSCLQMTMTTTMTCKSHKSTPPPPHASSSNYCQTQTTCQWLVQFGKYLLYEFHFAMFGTCRSASTILFITRLSTRFESRQSIGYGRRIGKSICLPLEEKCG